MKTATKNILKNNEMEPANKVLGNPVTRKVVNASKQKKDDIGFSEDDVSNWTVSDNATPESQKPGSKNTTSSVRKKSSEKLFVEYAGRQIAVDDVIESAKAHYKALFAKENGVLKTIEVYVKPEENVAYYVANGKGGNKYKVGL